MTVAQTTEEFPAQRGGAKALLLTVLGEFVLPIGGEVWTSTLVTVAETLGIGEKNARQAIARIGDQGLITSERHGRQVRWSLTPVGRDLLETGAQRIYEFGTSTVDWHGTWLVAHCPIAESQRTLRTQLRTRLGFLGFGELSASLLISPHAARETQLRDVLADLDLLAECVVLRSTTGSSDEDESLVERAWDLDALVQSYGHFQRTYHACNPSTAPATCRTLVEMVHDWRRYPFSDPELPTELLPNPWAGAAATATFHARHAMWSPVARSWFRTLEAGRTPVRVHGE